MLCALVTLLAQHWTYTLRSQPQMATISIPRSTSGVTNCGDSRISSSLHILAVARKVCIYCCSSARLADGVNTQRRNGRSVLRLPTTWCGTSTRETRSAPSTCPRCRCARSRQPRRTTSGSSSSTPTGPACCARSTPSLVTTMSASR